MTPEVEFEGPLGRFWPIEEVPTQALLNAAKKLLLEAGERQECVWCRSHTLKVVESVSALIYLASISEELKTHPGTLRAMRKVGEMAEELRMVKLLTKVSNSRIVRFLLNVR